MKKLQPWKLVSTKDVSVGKWFPIEERTYELPDGRIVDDFTVTTLPDVSLIIPFMKDGTVALCEQFKPGANEITYEFPGGRKEEHHTNLEETAKAELEEETGIKADTVYYFGQTVTFPTKASERVNNYYVLDGEITVQQSFDENEDINVVFFTPAQINEMIKIGQINTAPSMSAWLQLTLTHPELVS
jgi:8-oxo-dGTP pyrophosphatase MutT (NUDIX family)